MKQSIFFIIVIVLFSCFRTEKNENKLITKFESSLGKIETKYLNEMVADFDDFLEKKYNSKKSESRFKRYLEELSVMDSPEIWKAEPYKLLQYQKSKLFAKYDSIYPESVWIENDMINLKFKELDVVQSIIPINKPNLDSLVAELKIEPRLNLTVPSKFYTALKSVADKDSLIANYLSYREIAGNSPPYLLANGLLYSYKVETEYFAKRILIMELNE